MTDRRLRVFAWALVVVSLIGPPSALAQGEPSASGAEPAEPAAPADDEGASGAPVVLVVVDPNRAGLAQRVRAELTALGFSVRLSTLDEVASRAALEEAARQADAVAALQLSGQTEGVDVWVSDRVTGKTVLRRVPEPEGVEAAERDALVAIRAVELLRASLLEVATEPPPPGDVEPPPVVRRVVREALRPPPPAPDRFFIGIAPAVSASPGGVPPMGHLQLGVTGLPHPRVALELFAVTPLFPASLQGPEGLADLSIGHLGASIGGRATNAGPIDFRLGAGVAVSWLHVEASAAEPFIAQNEDTFVAWPFAKVHLGWATGSTVLFLDGRVGPVVPEPVIRFAEREVVRWGRPAVLIALGTELGF